MRDFLHLLIQRPVIIVTTLLGMGFGTILGTIAYYNSYLG